MTELTRAKSAQPAREREEQAFTLIELLVVISIIGVLAALLIPGAGIASKRMKIARVKAELNQIITGIENYKLEVGEYPPDNGQISSMNTNSPVADYEFMAASNPLYYELSGATFETTHFKVLNAAETITPADLTTWFKVSGIRNSARTSGDVPFKGREFKGSQMKEIETGSNADVELLVVTPKGNAVTNSTGTVLRGRGNTEINPWKYDRSSVRRKNRNSFDLWADLKFGDDTVRISNWSE